MDISNTNIQAVVITISCLCVVFSLVYSLYQRSMHIQQQEKKKGRMKEIAKSAREKGGVYIEELEEMEELFNIPRK